MYFEARKLQIRLTDAVQYDSGSHQNSVTYDDYIKKDFCTFGVLWFRPAIIMQRISRNNNPYLLQKW